MSDDNVKELAPKKPETLRSKVFGGLGLALIALGLAKGYSTYQTYQAKQAAEAAYAKAGEPTLLGSCWVIYGKVSLSFVATPTVATEEGPEKAYGTVMRVGPLAMPKLLPIRETNADMATMKKNGDATEVSCASGEPLVEGK